MPTPSLRSSGRRPRITKTKQPETHRPARKTSNRQKHQRPARRATATSKHSRARQEFLDSGPTSLPQGSWNVMPAATRKLSRIFKPGPDWEKCGVQREFPLDCRQTGSLASLRLTGRCQAHWPSSLDDDVCVTSESPCANFCSFAGA